MSYFSFFVQLISGVHIFLTIEPVIGGAPDVSRLQLATFLALHCWTRFETLQSCREVFQKLMEYVFFLINYWNNDWNQAWARQVNEVALMRQTQMEQNNILFISRWDAFSKVLFKLCSLNESETVKYCYFLFWTNHKWYISFTHHSGMSHSNGQKFSFTHHSQSVSINHLICVSFIWKHIVQTSLML